MFWSILPLVFWDILITEKYITSSVNPSNTKGIYVAYLALLSDKRQNISDGKHSQTNAHEATWAINKIPPHERKTASVPTEITAKAHWASWPSSERKEPSEQKMSFYLGGCIDNRDIIAVLKGASNANSTNGQEQRPAGELGNEKSHGHEKR